MPTICTDVVGPYMAENFLYWMHSILLFHSEVIFGNRSHIISGCGIDGCPSPSPQIHHIALAIHCNYMVTFNLHMQYIRILLLCRYFPKPVLAVQFFITMYVVVIELHIRPGKLHNVAIPEA